MLPLLRDDRGRPTAGRRPVCRLDVGYTRRRERPHEPAGRGWFITIEGPDGAGKTLVADASRRASRPAGSTSCVDPRARRDVVGERVRRIVLDHVPDEPPLDPRADALLFSAARAQLVAEVIRPALAAGTVVLDARHADSTLAYQGYGAGLPVATLRDLKRSPRVASGRT